MSYAGKSHTMVCPPMPEYPTQLRCEELLTTESPDPTVHCTGPCTVVQYRYHPSPSYSDQNTPIVLIHCLTTQGRLLRSNGWGWPVSVWLLQFSIYNCSSSQHTTQNTEHLQKYPAGSIIFSLLDSTISIFWVRKPWQIHLEEKHVFIISLL